MARTLVADHTGRLTRQRILQAALELFAERGYAGTSIALIAKRVGLSQPGVLHHFSDKRSLLIAVLEERDRVDADGRTGNRYEGLTIRQALDFMVDTVEHNLDKRDAIRLSHVSGLTAGADAEAAAEWSRARLARMRSDIIELGVRAREDGSISEDADIDGLASLVIATFLGLEQQWLLDPEFDMVTGMRTFTRLLATELGLGPAESDKSTTPH
ncbi:TetR/AcrR family transcriptional regulator [Nocardia sp. NEAU-G5]|uniref:TetR/AcrR family transcriptional regulator n=1 Tax=Nocardia albiluteola TaxID=2842303 RepID=A0ABS6B5V2_9NOCA|nr:TetR/AcrR family transcriptional regulator [Nocardia albiluteola]MBU3062532.1 TetR/AcrR family transcriptional regulator [Nocardia albiluteola]MBU3065634.1 TetR/AcrR family transcriptional regulator [Nocardia albiluteola]